MMDMQMIKEMAEDIDFACVDLSKDTRLEVARALTVLNYRKIPENAVVLSKEELDELKQAKILLSFREETIKYLEDANIRYAEALENKGKDTAKEIYGEIEESDILIVGTQEYGEIEVVSIERLNEIFRSKGVEVEKL